MFQNRSSVVLALRVPSHGQVGYAIMAARPGHSYDVRMRFGTPEYKDGENAKAIEAIMKRQEKLAEIKLIDPAKGLWEAKILPFKLDPGKQEPQGFHCGNLLHPIHDAAPKGLGLTFDFIGPEGKPDPLE